MSEQREGLIGQNDDWEREDEELGLVMVSREHDEITSLLPQLGTLHKSLREVGMTEHLGAVEDTICYLSARLQESWSEYAVLHVGLGKTALGHSNDTHQ